MQRQESTFASIAISLQSGTWNTARLVVQETAWSGMVCTLDPLENIKKRSGRNSEKGMLLHKIEVATIADNGYTR
jgi:hypothetical protein